jgi:hypothetical protein
MAQAASLAEKVAGVTAVFQDYSTTFTDRSNGVAAHWTASKTRGLAIGTLGWRVPQDELDAAGRQARLKALSSLRREAPAAAQTLGLSVAGYQSVDLSGGPTPIFGRPRPMMAMAAMVPPIATADSRDVTADVILADRPASVPTPR